MASVKYKDFSNRLVNAMKSNKHIASRSPNGICLKTLSEFAGASEQICRRYIRGEALPNYEKVIKIASALNTFPGWLLFGEEPVPKKHKQPKTIDDDLLHYILNKSHFLYKGEAVSTDDYADFVLELIRDVREINTTNENLKKFIELAMSSISSYKKKLSKSFIK
ncbi:MAG: helix-turn-helix transcriptional regulator [Tatlockia sp.]|nr:helix-turn-helix transcriptional regulator [Tatlockia sp.]